MNILKIKKLRDNAVIPTRSTPGSAGMDMYACIDSPYILEPGAIALIPTGVAIELDSCGVVAYLFARSGLSVKHGISLANGVGVIDSDYRGEVCAAMINNSSVSYTITPGERIAQMVISPVIIPQIDIVDELADSSRGEGGFGSTGKL